MSGKRKAKWLEMLPEELLAVLRECPVCYMPYGLSEPHGPYNALGLDFLKAEALCERAALEHGGVVAPAFAWHVQDQPRFEFVRRHGIEQTLCGGIPADLWLRLVFHQVAVFDARGFHAAILVTGHYGGLEEDMRLLCEFYVRMTGTPMRLHACADWELISIDGIGGDHGGIVETSQMMALRPDLVDLSRKVEEGRDHWLGVAFPTPEGKSPDERLGKQIVESQIERLGKIGKDLLASYVPTPGYAPPNQDEAENLWHRFERSTRKYWIMSLTFDEYCRGERVKFPGWGELGL